MNSFSPRCCRPTGLARSIVEYLGDASTSRDCDQLYHCNIHRILHGNDASLCYMDVKRSADDSKWIDEKTDSAPWILPLDAKDLFGLVQEVLEHPCGVIQHVTHFTWTWPLAAQWEGVRSWYALRCNSYPLGGNHINKWLNLTLWQYNSTLIKLSCIPNNHWYVYELTSNVTWSNAG